MAILEWVHSGEDPADHKPEPRQTVSDDNRLELRSPTWCAVCGRVVFLDERDESESGHRPDHVGQWFR